MRPEAEKLLRWYDAEHRRLPWRTHPSAYGTWVSETMLQQTRVETVIGYYLRFLDAFPDVAALARAEEAQVLKLWEGLGYYARARNLHRGARQVMTLYGGSLPRTSEELKTIHGIGPYTAAAIASIAFGEPVPAVDGNALRVISRLRGIRENVRAAAVAKLIDAEAAALVPPERPGDFNQAVMDLGARVCVPGTPDCDACPLRADCAALKAGIAEELPCVPKKKPPLTQQWTVALIRCGDRWLMRQRTESLLRGLWVFPMVEGRPEQSSLPDALERLTGLRVSPPSELGEARHVFTHRVWEMRLCAAQTEDSQPKEGWRFFTAEQLRALAVPTAMRGAVKALYQLADDR